MNRGDTDGEKLGRFSGFLFCLSRRLRDGVFSVIRSGSRGCSARHISCWRRLMLMLFPYRPNRNVHEIAGADQREAVTTPLHINVKTRKAQLNRDYACLSELRPGCKEIK